MEENTFVEKDSSIKFFQDSEVEIPLNNQNSHIDSIANPSLTAFASLVSAATATAKVGVQFVSTVATTSLSVAEAGTEVGIQIGEKITTEALSCFYDIVGYLIISHY